jgi:hypothetical protein
MVRTLENSSMPSPTAGKIITIAGGCSLCKKMNAPTPVKIRPKTHKKIGKSWSVNSESSWFIASSSPMGKGHVDHIRNRITCGYKSIEAGFRLRQDGEREATVDGMHCQMRRQAKIQTLSEPRNALAA